MIIYPAAFGPLPFGFLLGFKGDWYGYEGQLWLSFMWTKQKRPTLWLYAFIGVKKNTHKETLV
jgi:hypothetical protein